MLFSVKGLTIKLVEGDITELDTDAITNAANSALILGAGVAGAIARKGGAEIQRECNTIGRCEVGKAVITGGGNLKSRYVIHAVGPRMGEGNEPEKLASAIRSVLRLAEEKQLNSVAMPAISTGIFGFPLTECAKIMTKEILEFSFEQRAYLYQVVVCLYGKAAFETFKEIFIRDLSDIDDEAKDHTLLLE